MNLPEAFLAAGGGGWFGPEREAELGDRKCFLLVRREIGIGSFTGWDDWEAKDSSMSSASESGGSCL